MYISIPLFFNQHSRPTEDLFFYATRLNISESVGAKERPGLACDCFVLDIVQSPPISWRAAGGSQTPVHASVTCDRSKVSTISHVLGGSGRMGAW